MSKATEQSFHDDLHSHENDSFYYEPVFVAARQRAIDDFIRCAGLGAQSVVLSVGCGAGETERLLSPHVKQVVGIDISAAAIESARRRSEGYSNLAFETLDIARPEASSVPLAGNFDAVCFFGLLHHITDENMVAVLETARRALKPNGVVYSIDPNANRLVGHFKWLVRKKYEALHSPDERELRVAALSRTYEAAGLRVVRLSWADFLFFPFAYLFPQAPRWIYRPVELADRFLLALPGVRTLASSFSLTARGIA